MSTCKFCGSSQLVPFSAQERMFGLGTEFTYSECQQCYSLQLVDIPQDLAKYYSGEYYSFTGLTFSTALKNIFKKLRMKGFLALGWKVFQPSYGSWLRKLNLSFSDRIADVGCGNGQLLYELSVSGFKDLHGFDPFMEQTKQINSALKLWKKSIEEAEMKFDVIMMHHSFEHMEDPTLILEACFEKLNPGGKLLVRTPVSDAAVWKSDRTFWVQLDAPRHLIIPSTEGFRKVAHQIGFQLDELVFDSDEFQFWGTGLYKKGLPLDPSLVAKNITSEELKEFKEKALKLNQEGLGDQVCFYLTKPL